MSALSMLTMNHRVEERLRCDDFETMNFKALCPQDGPPMLQAIVQDKSASGLGIYVAPQACLQVGLELNLWDIMIYEVRWVKHVSEHIVNLGLMVAKEL